MCDVSIIYVNYNTIKLIEESIKSVIKYTKDISYEFIVVDNNTQDLNPLKIDSRIRTIQLSSNLGFGKANNEGSKIANGKYLFFLNPDTLLVNNAIKYLKEALDHHQRIGICGGNLFDKNLSPIHSYFDITLSFKYIFMQSIFSNSYLSNIKRQHNFTNRTKNVGYITGADLMIRKQLFDEIHGFSQYIFMYYEDVDLCYKAKKLGYQIKSVPTAKIIHLEGQSIEGENEEKIRKRRNMNCDSQAIFLQENYSRSQIFSLIHFYLSTLHIKKCILSILGKRTQGLSSHIAFINKIYLKTK